MAVTRWRALEEYHPAVRLMVRYMWRQEPPLLPSGFADQMGLPRQLVSRWLQIVAPAVELAKASDIPPTDATDPAAPTEPDAVVTAAPMKDTVKDAVSELPSLTPQLAVRLARAMGLAPLDFLVAAGLCMLNDPLLTIGEAWEYVIARVTASQNQLVATADETGESRDDQRAEGKALQARQDIRQILDEARLTDLANLGNLAHLSS
jgi:hypothetical protein